MGVGGRALFPEERMAVAEKDIAEAVAAHGMHLLSAIPGLATSRVEAAVHGLCRRRRRLTATTHWKLRYKGAVRDIFFHTTLEKAPGFLGTMLDLAAGHKYPAADVGVYLQPQHQGVAYHLEFSLPFAPGRQARDRQGARPVQRRQQAVDRRRRLLLPALRRVGRPGLQPGRRFGRDALRTVKKILDPNNVLNPSKLCF